MINLPEEQLKRLIKCNACPKDMEYRQWFINQFDDDADNLCSLEEFAIYFINTLRRCTDVHLKTSGAETPKCQTPVRVVSKLFNNKDEMVTPKRLLTNPSQQKTSTPNENSNISNNQLNNNSSLEMHANIKPRLSSSLDRLGLPHNNTISTPVKRNVSKNTTKRLSTTSATSSKSASSSLCLGDFLVLNTTTNSRSHKKKTTPTASQQSAQKPQNDKPKKRVQPISISKKVEKSSGSPTVFGGESSFSNENNILKISNTELEDKDQCAILAARKSLALNASEITREIETVCVPLTPVKADTIATSTPLKDIAIADFSLDLGKVKNNKSLRRLAEIYSFIIDLNLTANVLNEFSFLLNLFNAPNGNNLLNAACSDVDQLNLNDNDSYEKGLLLLNDFSNAIYFALLCLELEKNVLACLDSKSLGVILISERFSYLSEDIRSYLLQIYQRKQQSVAEKPFYDTSLNFDSKACNNVHFQHEQDSRENFTSQQEFTNFRAQRDLFYKCLKIWETNHINPTWRFSLEITPQIREIFHISENCINMAHLAKLFVSQLLLSVTNTTSPEDIGLDVDLLKFSKLSQRLIAPSQFSVDYQFPRTEAFFRDFILEARSLTFAEQLKMELWNQLTTQNDSSLDHINIGTTNDDADEENVALNGCSSILHTVVTPDILNSMIVLAKFLGFAIALPYNISNSITVPSKVEKHQIRLRSIMQPLFDVCLLLEQSIEQNRLLIVIPWLVQYFAMLDNITLQLENCMNAIKLLFALYCHLGFENSKTFCSTSLFIINLCIGWLFESKQFIAEQYYNYRAMLKAKNPEISQKEYHFVKSHLKCNAYSHNVCESVALNPYLESLIPTACPFLAEFRVSIMPAKYAQTKNASRTGRYRHITTRIAELPATVAAQEDGSPSKADESKSDKVQKSLIQAFLHSQNASTRQIIKFCTERCYKSTVKDGQLKILLPAKSNADNLVNQITSFQYQFVYSTIKNIYDEAYKQAKAEWEEYIPQVLHRRINNALESLLPEETSLVLKKTYLMIIEKEATIKISQWFYGNIVRDNYFNPHLNEMAENICSANEDKVQLGSNVLTLTKESPIVSDLIDELQYWLHCTSIRVERFKGSEPLVHLLENIIKSFENELPSFLYHLFGSSILKILQHIITKSCSHLSDELIDVACQVWLHPNMQKALHNFSSSGICIYDPLITVAFIESLGTKVEGFNQLAHLLITLIQKNVITINYVNDIFVSIFKHEWHPHVLNEISNMLKSIVMETSEVLQKPHIEVSGHETETRSGICDEDDNEKSNLFMDMLADLSRDVDFF